MMAPTTLPHLTGLLEKHFGYATFRPLQEDIIKTVLSGKDCCVIMPTGSGKSLCFQLPALCLDGVTLVISPLIALMKDQVDGLQADGIAAAFLNSSQSMAEQSAVMTAVQNGTIKLLYIAPERIAQPGFEAFLGSIRVSMLAIDEAHCISEWGHEFRPEYRNLHTLRQKFSEIPCIALTATATPKVQEDIREQLKLSDGALFLSSFNRENLTYHVYAKQRSFERLLVALRSPQKLPAIAYCYSRKATENLAKDLQAEGFSCLPYHAGLDPDVRRETQEKFMRDEISIITATIAFGMGIDKPDVRTVIHMDLPKNIEGYYQETGRAGRDGLPSDCILFYSYGDKFKQDFFIDQIEDPTQQRLARQNLERMLEYGELGSCRRAYLLKYFGENVEFSTCRGCDRCLTPEVTFDATEITQKILSAVIRTGERFGGAYICDVLLGKNTERIRAQQHDQLSVYGIVKEFDDRQLREIMTSLAERKLLLKAEGQYPTLFVTVAGREFLLEKKTLMLRRPEEIVAVAKRQKQADELTFDEALFEELRALRRTLANERNVAAFIIFGDRSLREMAAFLPQTIESFQEIYGVSDKKSEQYGQQFLAIIQNFAATHDVTPKEMPISRKSRNPAEAILRKGSTYEETRLLVQQKISLAEIARTRNLKESTISQHIEELSAADQSLDVAYLKPTPAVFQEITTAFGKYGSGALSPIFQHFEGKYSYEIIRMVRMFLRRETE